MKFYMVKGTIHRQAADLGENARYLLHYLGQWFSEWVIRPPRGHRAMSGDISGYHNCGWWCATGT